MKDDTKKDAGTARVPYDKLESVNYEGKDYRFLDRREFIGCEDGITVDAAPETNKKAS